MSKELNKIPTTCPIFDKIVNEIETIEETLGEKVYSLISYEIDCIRDYADEIRNISADLRDCCVDIVDEKNSEIEELENKIEELES